MRRRISLLSKQLRSAGELWKIRRIQFTYSVVNRLSQLKTIRPIDWLSDSLIDKTDALPYASSFAFYALNWTLLTISTAKTINLET